MKLFGFFGWFEAVTLAIAIGGPILYVMDRETKIERGYCFAEGRYLSEQEIVDRAVMAVVNQLSMFRESQSLESSMRFRQYSSLDEFYSANPDCCRTEWKPPDNTNSKQSWRHRSPVTFVTNRPFEGAPERIYRVLVVPDFCGYRERLPEFSYWRQVSE